MLPSFFGEDSCCMRRVVRENHRLEEVQEGGDDGGNSKKVISYFTSGNQSLSWIQRKKTSLQLYVAQVVRTSNREKLHYVQYLWMNLCSSEQTGLEYKKKILKYKSREGYFHIWKSGYTAGLFFIAARTDTTLKTVPL